MAELTQKMVDDGGYRSMKRFWMSWYDAEPDYRPLNDPPNEAILGWWVSGETMEEPPRVTICAWVQAETLVDACVAVAREWPETAQPKTKWRFDDERPSDWLPSGRFPLDAWSLERIGRSAVSNKRPSRRKGE